VSSETVIFL